MKMMTYCLWVSVVVVLCLVGDIHAAVQDVCIGYEFSASCGLSEVLVMETAEFGRMSPGRCITAERGYTVGCTNDVLNLADRWCSGLDKCSFDVTNKDLEEANTNCNKNLKAYFLATYTCVRVEDPSQSCKSGIAPSSLTNIRGTISSHTFTNSRCGSARAPWRIEAQVGQTIKISLVDFQALDREGSRTSLSCVHVYGFILERALNINQTICGQRQRESLLYTSKTNTVEIYLQNDGDVRFLLEYEVSGCAEITPPPGGWYKRNGNEAVIGCEKNGQEWKLKCEGSTWQGSMGNCSQPVIAASVAKPALGLTLPSGKIQYKVIAVTGMIGATVVIAIAVVVFGVVYIKKYRDQRERSYVRSKKGQEEKAFALVPAATSALNTNYRPLSGVSTASMYLQPTLPLQTVDLVPVESEQQKQQQQQQKAQQQQQQSQQQQQQEQQTKVKTPDSLLLEMMKIEESGDQVEGATTTCAHEATSFTRGQQQEGVTGTTYPIPGHKYYVLEQGFAQ